MVTRDGSKQVPEYLGTLRSHSGVLAIDSASLVNSIEAFLTERSNDPATTVTLHDGDTIAATPGCAEFV